MSHNIIFITTHDLGKHLNLYGVESVRSPHLNSLAEDSVVFDNHFCTAPQCSPSRATLHTGRYAHSVGMLGLAHEPFNWRLHNHEKHLAQLLRENGYNTALVGLQHLVEDPLLLRKPDTLGYNRALPVVPARELASSAVELMRDMASQEAPFYLEAGFFETHREYDWGGALPDDSNGVWIPPYLPANDLSRQDFAALQGMVRVMDEGIGQIIDALKELDLYDETLIVFTTDHGIAMPRAKCTLYDPGIAVSLLMRLPGDMVDAQRVSAMTSHIDVVPTVLGILGLSLPDNLHGHTLMPLLQGKEARVHDAIFAEKTYHTAYEPMRGIRTDTHKLIVNFAEDVAVNAPADIQNSPIYPTIIPMTSQQRPDFELYDLQRDRNELVNLANDEEHSTLVKDLSSRLYSWMQETEDPLLRGVPLSPQHLRMMQMLSG